MTARRKRGAALIIGGLLGLLFTLLSAVQVAGWTIGAVEHTSRQTLPGPVKNLTVDAGPGEIQILPSQDGDVHVETYTKGSLHAPRVRAVKDGTHVMMSGNCPAFSFGPCDAEIVLHVPVGTAVDVHSSSGDVVASGVGGPLALETDSGDVAAIGVTGSADLRTASGDVDLRGGSGEVRLESQSGDVSAGDVASERISAETQSGDVDLDFRVPPRMVDAKATSGDVSVALPDAESYDVVADTGSGDSQIGVRTDPDAPRKVLARTNSGDVTIGYGN
jgi:Putative adhesin